MAHQPEMESCSLCLRSITQRRHIKGSTRLKHSGSSASEVVNYIIGQEIPRGLLCSRCYRLILGTDFHQYKFKRLKDSLVNIYLERCISVERTTGNPDSSRSTVESSSSLKDENRDSAVEVSYPSSSELSIAPYHSDLNNEDLIEYQLQDSTSITNQMSIKSVSTNQEVGENGVKQNKVMKSEQADFGDQERYLEGNQIRRVCNLIVRSSKRRKRVKKLKDFEYYADISKDSSESYQYEHNVSETILSDTETKKFCPLCHKDFALRKDYVNHSCVQIIEKDHSLECKGCQMPFSERQHYIKHINSCYKNVPVKCHLCMVELQSAAYLPRHFEAFHNGAALTQKRTLCDQCGRTFSRKEALQRHQAKVHGVSHGTHQCAKCGQTFLHTSLLMEHVRAHKGYPCPECKKTFTCMSNLTLHKQTFHLNKTLYHCSPCNKRWRFHASYTNHMRKIHGKGPFKCSKCKMLFSAENAFERHREACAGVFKKPFQHKFNSGTSASLKGKLDTLNVSENHAFDSRIDLSVVHSKVSDTNCDVNHDRNYLRLKKVVKKVTPPAQQQISLPSKEVTSINRKPNRTLRETVTATSAENYRDSHPATSTGDKVMLMPSTYQLEDNQLIDQGTTSLSSSSEIVLETLEDLSSDCQYVILVEDGSSE